ncbi:MAG: heme o synthase [Alphaproteobacteria bacterium]
MTDTSVTTAAGTAPGDTFAKGAQVGDFIALLKPRVMSLVVFTGIAGLIAAPGQLHPLLAAVAILCIAVAAGAAGAINMWYDRDIDAVMARTRGRPLPAGRMAPDEALAFGITLSLFSVMLMAVATNLVAAALLAAANGFYVLVYTMWLKRRTPQNIVIGGAAGAFPPVIGWVAVTGQVDMEALALFLIIFLWTPPHFWALALYRSDDYAKAGVPMLPVVAGAAVTRRQIFIYSVSLVIASLLPTVLGTAGLFYGAVVVLLGGTFLVFAFTVLRDTGLASARRLFAFSILYLFLLFAALIADRISSLGGIG